MNILITGGAGFIGSAIYPVLIKHGHDVAVIDNLSFGNRDYIDIADDKFYKIDIRNKDDVNEVLNTLQPEIIIHLAAIHFIPYCNEHPFEATDINIRGTLNVLEASRNIKKLKKVLFASTAAVYPIADEAVSETHTLQPMDIYGISKLAGERLFHEFYLETGVNSIICRFFNAFGPNETNPHLIPEIEHQIKAGDRTIRLGNLTPKRDFIHTYDMANAIKLLLFTDIKDYEVFNLGRGIEYSVTEIVQSFERELGEKIEIEVEESRVRKVERMHLLANVDKLKKMTGWEPEWSIDEGIRNLLQSS
jgi:UDP-glucose 4-epimerase